METALEYGGIDTAPFELGPVDLKIAVTILREAVLVGWAPSCQVDVVDLRDEAAQRSGGRVDLFTVVGPTRGVNVESGQNLPN